MLNNKKCIIKIYLKLKCHEIYIYRFITIECSRNRIFSNCKLIKIILIRSKLKLIVYIVIK